MAMHRKNILSPRVRMMVVVNNMSTSGTTGLILSQNELFHLNNHFTSRRSGGERRRVARSAQAVFEDLIR
jgi:hypothetical protein